MNRDDLTPGMHVAVVGPLCDHLNYEERVVESLADPEDGLGYVTTSAVNSLGYPLGGTGHHTRLVDIVSPWADRPTHQIEVPYVVAIRVDHEPRGWLSTSDHKDTAASFAEAVTQARKAAATIAATEAAQARDPLYRARIQVTIVESAQQPGFPHMARHPGRLYTSGWTDVYIEIERLRRLTEGA